MKKMEFRLKNVRDCLLKHGKVYTVRSYYAWNGGEEVLVEVDGVGLALRKYVKEVTKKEDLLLFVALSGFENVDDWWKAIEFWCAGKRKWLYFVFRKPRWYNNVGE